MSIGEAFAETLPILVLFCGIVGLMAMESYILRREKHMVYIMLVLSLFYCVAEFLERMQASDKYFHYGRMIFAALQYIIIPFIPLLFFYLVAKPKKWAISLWFIASIESVVFAYSLFSQQYDNLPNLGIRFTINNEIEYGSLFFITYICPFIPLLLSLVFQVIQKIKNEIPTSSVVISFFLVFTNIAACVIEKTTSGVNLTGKIAFLSVTIYYAWLYVYYLKVHQEEVLQKSEIDIMISQIHPHFLYNTLNSIYYLCGKDDNLAKKTIDDFSTYLRLNLRSLTSNEEISIDEELHHVETYLNIEKLRFGDRLNFEFQIEDRDFKVPALILQPLVENAVKHGICEKENGGTVIVKIYKENQQRIIKVLDNGAGFDTTKVDFSKGDHVGFNNTKKRVELMLHGTLEIKSEVGKGTEVTIRI